MLNALIPNPDRRFHVLPLAASIAFAWVFPPLTVFAVGYRYLRAHEWELTLYHSFLAAVAIVGTIEFWRNARRTLRSPDATRLRSTSVVVAGSLVGTPLLFVYAQVLIDAGPSFPGRSASSPPTPSSSAPN